MMCPGSPLPRQLPRRWPRAESSKTPFRGTFRIRNLLPPELRGGFYFLMDGRTLEMDIRALRNPNVPVPRPANHDRPLPPNRSRSQYDPRLRLQGHAVLGGVAEQ